VPDRCRITIDRRFLIEEDIAEVKAEVAALMEKVRAARPGFDYEIRDLFEVQPTMTDRDAPVVRTVQAAIERVLHRHAEFVVSPGTYDQKHIDRIGRLKNCIAYGPGILDLAHQPDEWVGIDDMVDSRQGHGADTEGTFWSDAKGLGKACRRSRDGGARGPQARWRRDRRPSDPC
jgi:succinyl-diaminopimelate desuccinylase